MPTSELPTYRAAVYIVFDGTALGFILEAVPHLAREEWRIGCTQIGIAIALVFVGIGIARQIGRISDAIKASLATKSSLLSENAKLKAQLSSDITRVDVCEYPLEVFHAIVSADDPVPATNKSVTYRNKIRINLSNVSGKDIHVWAPVWQSGEVVAQWYGASTAAPGSRFRLRASDGSWVLESKPEPDGTFKAAEDACIGLKAGGGCDCYIGLDPGKEQNLKDMLRAGVPLGTALFAVKIDGRLYFKKVKC